jgi:hypothetical protein
MSGYLEGLVLRAAGLPPAHVAPRTDRASAASDEPLELEQERAASVAPPAAASEPPPVQPRESRTVIHDREVIVDRRAAPPPHERLHTETTHETVREREEIREHEIERIAPPPAPAQLAQSDAHPQPVSQPRPLLVQPIVIDNSKTIVEQLPTPAHTAESIAQTQSDRVAERTTTEHHDHHHHAAHVIDKSTPQPPPPNPTYPQPIAVPPPPTADRRLPTSRQPSQAPTTHHQPPIARAAQPPTPNHQPPTRLANEPATSAEEPAPPVAPPRILVLPDLTRAAAAALPVAAASRIAAAPEPSLDVRIGTIEIRAAAPPPPPAPPPPVAPEPPQPSGFDDYVQLRSYAFPDRW